MSKRHKNRKSNQQPKKPKATCPRCGNQNATPNAQGPLKIWCKPCGGLVDLRCDDEYDIAHSNPVINAEMRERGVFGSITNRPTPVAADKLRGGTSR